VERCVNLTGRTLIGVDAGASHTTAAVADGHGTVLVRAEGAPGAVRPGGADGAAARIVDTCREALVKADRALGGDVLVVGAAGAGREAERLALQAALEATRLFGRVHVTTDGGIALQSAFGDGFGIVVMAGTGSIAWARLPDGAAARAGGLGAALGDPGSGYDLGRAALRGAALSLEGMAPRTRLAEALLRQLHLAGLDDLVHWAGAASVPTVAALAADVLELAAAGDDVAGAIADAGADALARHVAALASRYPDGTAVPVALGGGLLARSEEYRRRVVARILAETAAAAIRTQPVDAVLGAIQLARSL
jgi:N-acetylglucosamine kinase-like BadF-type ATPase